MQLNTIQRFGIVLLLSGSSSLAQDQTVNLSIAGPGVTLLYSFTNGPASDCGNNGYVLNATPSIATIVPGLTFKTTGSISNFTLTGVSPGIDTIQIHYGTTDPTCTLVSGVYTLIVTVGTGALTPPSTVANTPNVVPGGEPVSTATGELFGYDEKPDLISTGPLSLGFRRYYGSYLSANGVASALGTNWMSNFDVSLGVSGGTAKATLFRGKNVSFQQTNGLWQLSSTEQRPFQLIAAGPGYQLLDPRSNRIYVFTSTGALTAIQDRNGNTLNITQGPNGPVQVSDGLGRTLTLTYFGTSLIKVQDQTGRSVAFQSTGGNLTSFTDANGKITTFAYTSSGGLNGLMTSETLPNGNQPFTQTFDAQGRVATQSHAIGTTMTFTYNPGANSVTTAEPGGPTLTYVSDASLNLTALTDFSGVGSMKTYDPANRLLTSTDRVGAVQALTYDAASGLPATSSDPLGNITAFNYNSTAAGGFTFYDLAKVVFADGTSVSYSRDGKGNLLSSTDEAGKTRQFTYNAAGEVTALTNPLGAVTSLAYGSDATMSSVQLASGDITTVGYDAAKRPTQVNRPDGTVLAMRFDPLDNLIGITDERDDASASAVDANDNLHSVTDARNASTAFAYDADDRLSSTTDALGHAIARAYDMPGRLQAVTDATGVGISYSYDSLNRPVQALDTAGKGLRFGWDQEARLLSVTDALSRTVNLTRDARGLITVLKTPANETFSTVWDALRRPVSRTDPLGRVTTRQYESRGLLTSLALPGGVASTYSYNDLRLLTGATDPNGNLWSFAWDKQGRLLSRTDPLGQTTSRQYDSRQRLSSLSFPQGNEHFTYDGVGNVTSRAYSDGTKVDFTYDADNRLTAATDVAISYDASGRVTASNGLQIARDPAGRIASITYAPGKTVHYSYDNRGLLTQITDWVGGASTFTYDAAHQLISRTLPNGVSESYSYDGDGRPIAIRVSNGQTSISSIALTRDALGRVTAAVRSAPNVPDVPNGYLGLEYDAASQSFASTFDGLGRPTQDATAARTYTWDLASRLTSYSGADGAASFTYDAMGQRISSTSGGVTQHYVLDYALPQPSVATIQTGGADLRYYIWLSDGALLESVEASGGARHFYHFDESGSTNFLTGDTGAVTDSYAGTPYGETMVQTGSTPNPFTFQGAFGVMQEGATGLYYMRARYFDSTSARFLSRDPLPSVDPRAINPYQFVSGMPIGRFDPSGLDEEEAHGPGAGTSILDLMARLLGYEGEITGPGEDDEDDAQRDARYMAMMTSLNRGLSSGPFAPKSPSFINELPSPDSAFHVDIDNSRFDNWQWGGPPMPFSWTNPPPLNDVDETVLDAAMEAMIGGATTPGIAPPTASPAPAPPAPGPVSQLTNQPLGPGILNLSAHIDPLTYYLRGGGISPTAEPVYTLDPWRAIVAEPDDPAWVGTFLGHDIPNR